MRFEKRLLPGVPPDFRRASAGLPPQSVRKTKPTTYPSDRYDSTTRAFSIHPCLFLYPKPHNYFMSHPLLIQSLQILMQDKKMNAKIVAMGWGKVSPMEAE